MTSVARLFKVICRFGWQAEGDFATWHCGSLDGARRLVEKKINQGDLLWYSIDGQEFLPCEESDPDGQLYIRIIYHEFRDLRKG